MQDSADLYPPLPQSCVCATLDLASYGSSLKLTLPSQLAAVLVAINDVRAELLDAMVNAVSTRLVGSRC